MFENIYEIILHDPYLSSLFADRIYFMDYDEDNVNSKPYILYTDNGGENVNGQGSIMSIDGINIEFDLEIYVPNDEKNPNKLNMKMQGQHIRNYIVKLFHNKNGIRRVRSEGAINRSDICYMLYTITFQANIRECNNCENI